MEIEFKDIKKDNHARKGKLILHLPTTTKSIITPSVLVKPTSGVAIDYICEWIGQHNPQHFGGLVIPLLSYKKIMASKESMLYSHTMDDFIDDGETIYTNIRENMLTIIDPQSENAYYKDNMNENLYADLPKEYVDMALNMPSRRTEKLDLYQEFSNRLLKRSYSYTLQFLKKEKKAGADILLPPSTLIIPEIPETLNAAIKINREATEICRSKSGWIGTSYFLLKVSLFEDYTQVKPIIDYVKNYKPKMLIFKMVDAYSLDSRNAAIQRMNLHKFLVKLNEITDRLKIPVFWLDLDSLGIFLSLIGTDGFSTPINGYIEKIYAAPKNIQVPTYLKGTYFHYSLLSMVPFKFIYNLHKNGQPLPCPYGCCEGYNQINLKTLSPIEKSKMCKIHYMNTLNGLLGEIDD